MNHLDDPTLNAYLDSALEPRASAQATEHLAACPECRARLASLQALFAEIEALPDLPLERDLSAQVVLAIKAKSLARPKLALGTGARLALALQLILLIVALGVAAPLALKVPALSQGGLPIANLSTLFIRLETALMPLWSSTATVAQGLANTQSFLTQLPALSVVALLPLLVGITLLWLVGNGLLLRHTPRWGGQ